MNRSGDPAVTVVGSVNIDSRFAVRKLPLPGETVMGHEVTEQLGGKGANQAVALARLGATTRLIGCVGEEEWVRTELEQQGVDITGLRTVSGPTGRAAVIVDADGENSIVLTPGANALLGPEEVEEAFAHLDVSDVLLLQAEVPLPAITAAARRPAGLVVYNPAPATDGLDPLLAAEVDVLVPNRSELATLTSSTLAEDIDAVVQQARKLPVAKIVVTLGSDGCVVLDEEGVSHVEAPRVDAVDTTGAGDAFCAGLSWALLNGAPLREAAVTAVHCGSLSATRVGAQTGPTRAELAREMRTT